MSSSVPYIDLSFQNEALEPELMAACQRVFRNNSYILGPEVDAFEQDFSKYVQAKHCIGVNSGTSALHLATLLLDLRPGDEVITTPFTFAATAWAISYTGATPVFVDIDPYNYNMEPSLIEAAITPKTRAIIAVHLYGHPCDMDPIVDICNKHKLHLIEDVAQAHGAAYKSQPVGSFGNMAIYSFYPAKNLGACGEAGALTTDEAILDKRARLLRNHGSRERYVHEEVGYNYRMEGLQAALLNVKLPHLEEWTIERQKIASDYNALLEEVTEIQLPLEAIWAESVYHLYTISCPKREQLIECLQAEGIGYSTHYAKPLHLQPCYKDLGYKPGSLPVAEKCAKEVLNLPLYPGLTQEQIRRVVAVIKTFYGYSTSSTQPVEADADTVCDTLLA